MRFKITVNGVMFECDSREEALWLGRSLMGAEAPIVGDQGHKNIPENPASKYIQSIQNAKFEGMNVVEQRAQRYLELLRHLIGKTAGVPTPELCKLLGIKSNRGFGGIRFGAEKALERLGFKEPNTVFKDDWGPHKDRRWFPGEKIKEAIKALEGDSSE